MGRLSSFSARGLGRHLASVLVLQAALPALVRAQTPPRLPFQDQLDLQANSNVIQGSGARAFGMGGAFLARADDATAASWNPAGLSYLRRPEVSFVMVGADFRALSVDPQNSLFLDDKHHSRAPDFLAFTYPLTLGTTTGAAQISYQRVLSFDADRTIEEPTPGTPSPTRTRSVRSRGGFDVIAFGSGWQISRRFRFGLTVNRWIDGYNQTLECCTGTALVPRAVPTRQNASFSFKGWNAHFGVIWSPFDSLNLGAVYKSAFSGDATLSRSRLDTYNTSEGPVTTTNAYSRDDLLMTFPSAFGVGTSWRPRSNLTLSFDYTRAQWSAAYILNFFTLPKTELGEAPPVPTAPTDFFPVLPYPSLDSSSQQQDTSQLRVGAEYVILREHLKVPIRAGFFTDDQYFDAVGGAPRFTGLTVGAGLIIGPVLLDVAYLHETGSYTTLEPLAGDEKLAVRNDVKSNQLFVSIIYRHPKH
jgi:hypothetical protein